MRMKREREEMGEISVCATLAAVDFFFFNRHIKIPTYYLMSNMYEIIKWHNSKQYSSKKLKN